MESLLKQPLRGEKTELVKRFGLETKLVPDATRATAARGFKWQVVGDYFDLKPLNLEVQPATSSPVTDRPQHPGHRHELRPVPKSASNAEPIRLLVVSAGDLLVEIGREEDALRGKLDEALVKLAAAKPKYAFVSSKHITLIPDEIDACASGRRMPAKTSPRRADCSKRRPRLPENRARCVINQLDEKTIVQYGRFANRLDRVLGENPQTVSPEEEERLREGKLNPQKTFPETEKLIATAQNMLEEGRYADPPALVTEADLAINALEREVADIRKELGESQSNERLKKLVASIIESQLRVRADIKKWERELVEILVSDEPLIGSIGAVFLAKGETKKIKHSLNWRQYKKDDLTVKVTVSEAGVVTVPGELKLEFEKNQFDFTYELRAGNKDGEVTVTLTPEVGKKVEFKVTVK